VSVDDVAVFFDNQFIDNQVVFNVRRGKSNSSRIRVFGKATATVSS